MNTKFRMLSHAIRRFSSNVPYEELKIPMPWGHVAAKWWGPQNRRPVLALHGWQDNCGSFDRLIPILNPKFGYLAIDFPGHGLSSNLPSGTSYYWIDYVITVRRIVKHFNWRQVSILGHSIGGATGYYYELVYPGEVDFLVTIDALKPITQRTRGIISQGETIDNLIESDRIMGQNTEAPAYTKEELIQRMHALKSINLEMCEYVLKRNIKESTVTPGKFCLTRDMRLRVLPLLHANHEDVMDNTDRLLCPTLYFKASINEKRYMNLTTTKELTDILKKTKSNFEMHFVDGTHHVHLNTPEKLHGFINAFMDKYDVKDRTLNSTN